MGEVSCWWHYTEKTPKEYSGEVAGHWVLLINRYYKSQVPKKWCTVSARHQRSHILQEPGNGYCRSHWCCGIVWRSCMLQTPSILSEPGRENHPHCRNKVLEKPFAPQKPGRRGTLSPPAPLLHPLQTKLTIKPSDKREIFTVLLLPSPGPKGLATCQWGLVGTLGWAVLFSCPIFLFHIWNEIINIKNYFLIYSVVFPFFRGSGK